MGECPNVDFHTWRDVTPDQIGARIRAERVNRYSANNALVQSTDLTFHTSPGYLQSDLTERMRIQHLGNVGIGTATPNARLHVNGASNASLVALFTRGKIPATNGQLYIYNTSADTNHFIPGIRARAYVPGRAFGMVLVGEADDIAATGADHMVAAVMIDGRSKTDTRLLTNNVLSVNSAGVNLMMVKGDGSVGIGAVDTKGYKLAVNGNAVFTKVVVKAFANWPDYVFADGYNLRPILDLARYVAENRRLPGMPSANDIAASGQDIGEVNRQLLEKVEELTLYIIQLNKRLDAQQQQLDALQEAQSLPATRK